MGDPSRARQEAGWGWVPQTANCFQTVTAPEQPGQSNDECRSTTLMRNYFLSTTRALISPWRADAGLLMTGPKWRPIVIAFFHITIAAVVCTLTSNWVYLAGKGIVLGAPAMDLGGDDLPPDTIGQVAGGLIGSMLVWAAMMAAMVGVCVVVADWLYLHDGAAFGNASKRACLLSIWFVVWAVAMMVANLERGEAFFHPARWPDGDTWEVRDRLIYLVVVFPVLWAVALRPAAGRRNPLIVAGFVTAAIVACWIAWVGLWRATPWVTIDAVTG